MSNFNEGYKANIKPLLQNINDLEGNLAVAIKALEFYAGELEECGNLASSPWYIGNEDFGAIAEKALKALREDK